MFNKGMGNIYKQAQKMQKNINKIQEELKNMNIEAEIGPRTKLTLDEYEELHENKRGLDGHIRSANKEFVVIDV